MSLGIELKEDGQAIRTIWNHLNNAFEEVKGIETLDFEKGFETKEQFLEFVSGVCKMIIQSDKEEVLDESRL
jgi:hypothetical protein